MVRTGQNLLLARILLGPLRVQLAVELVEVDRLVESVCELQADRKSYTCTYHIHPRTRPGAIAPDASRRSSPLVDLRRAGQLGASQGAELDRTDREDDLVPQELSQAHRLRDPAWQIVSQNAALRKGGGRPRSLMPPPTMQTRKTLFGAILSKAVAVGTDRDKRGRG